MSRGHPFKSRRGRRIREVYLRSVFGLCEDCREQGVTRVAVEVHHKVPVSEGGAPYDYSNMRAVCRDHHLEAHGQLKPTIDPRTGLPAGNHPWSER